MLKKTLTAAVMVAALVFGGMLQVQANEKCSMCAGKMDAEKKTDKLALILNLNDKQKGQVKDLVDAKIKKLEPAMEEMKKQHEQASESFEAGLKKILSADQAKKFEAWKNLEKDSCKR